MFKSFQSRASRRRRRRRQCSGFNFHKLIFHSGCAGALPSCANVCKCPKTDFLPGASGSTRGSKHQNHSPHRQSLKPETTLVNIKLTGIISINHHWNLSESVLRRSGVICRIVVADSCRSQREQKLLLRLIVIMIWWLYFFISAQLSDQTTSWSRRGPWKFCCCLPFRESILGSPLSSELRFEQNAFSSTSVLLSWIPSNWYVEKES